MKTFFSSFSVHGGTLTHAAEIVVARSSFVSAFLSFFRSFQRFSQKIGFHPTKKKRRMKKAEGKTLRKEKENRHPRSRSRGRSFDRSLWTLPLFAMITHDFSFLRSDQTFLFLFLFRFSLFIHLVFRHQRLCLMSQQQQQQQHQTFRVLICFAFCTEMIFLSFFLSFFLSVFLTFNFCYLSSMC